MTINRKSYILYKDNNITLFCVLLFLYIITERCRMSISPNSEINDLRMQDEFRSYSFSKFKKTIVCQKILDSIQKNKIEPACYWAAELICAGHYMDLWELFLKYAGKHIHLGNPKIVKYLEMRYTIFNNIIKSGHFSSELQLRNNATIRKLFAEIIVILSYSDRKYSLVPIQINREEEFDISQIREKLLAPSATYADCFFKKDDPRELFIALNEFVYSISLERHNMRDACYWIEWIIDFDALCRKRREPMYCERRKESELVDYKLQTDVIWIVWETLVAQSKLRGPFIESIMQSILKIFSIKYTTAASKKRRYLLYFAIAILTEPVPTHIELTTKRDIIVIVMNRIDDIYCQIKKNEISPNMNYLYSNLEKEMNLEKSLRKIDMMNSMGILPKSEETDETHMNER